MGNKKLNLALTIVAGLVFLSAFVVTFIFLVKGIDDKYPLAGYILLSVIPLASILFVYFFNKYMSIIVAVRNIKSENLYNLGEATAFFGVQAFIARVTALSSVRKLAKRKQYLMAFTAANLVTMQNANRDDAVTLLNAQIAKFLDKTLLHKANSKKKRNDIVVCFYRGSFLVYIFTNDEHEIRRIVDEISNEIFKISDLNQIHIYVQPFFGVTEIEGEHNMLESIENANIARNVSERNFETLTFYHESFRKRSSKEEIDEINDALANNEFVVYYQPKLNLTTRRFISAEALVRWNSKKHG